jgi:hypothetical protein
MQARRAFRIESMEAIIDGRMPARSSSDDRGSSIGKLATQRKSRLVDRLPRGNDGKLRNPVKKQDLRRFKMRRRIKAFDLADKFAGGLRSGSEGWRREG